MFLSLNLLILFTYFVFVLQAQRGLVESSHKLDILKLSLEKRLKELPQGSPNILQIREELATGKSEVNQVTLKLLLWKS